MSGEPTRRRWWREPLVHFLAIGAVLFALDRVRHRGAGSATGASVAAATIVVDRSVRDALAAEFAMRFGRPPDDSRLEALVQDWIRDEALVREATRLGLDRGDPVVRRRLAQKMTLVIESSANTATPTEQELEAWLGAHRDRYRLPARTSFTHAFFARDRRHDAARSDALAALAAGGDPARGDAFPLGASFEQRTDADVERDFGADFARVLQTAPTGAWTGPVASRWGEHLVLVRARSGEREARLDEVRAGVVADYQSAAREQAVRAATVDVVSRYRVVSR